MKTLSLQEGRGGEKYLSYLYVSPIFFLMKLIFMYHNKGNALEKLTLYTYKFLINELIYLCFYITHLSSFQEKILNSIHHTMHNHISETCIFFGLHIQKTNKSKYNIVKFSTRPEVSIIVLDRRASHNM